MIVHQTADVHGYAVWYPVFVCYHEPLYRGSNTDVRLTASLA